MSIERVKEFFRGRGMEGRIRELESSSATVELAAEALGCEPARIAKTLSFMLDGPILIVAAGDAKIALPRRGGGAYRSRGGRRMSLCRERRGGGLS